MLILFFAAWIIFNGKITLEIVLFGVVIAAFVFAFMCKFMDYSMQKELSLYKKGFSIAGYLFVLIKEIRAANLAVIHMILTNREVTEPTIVKFRTNLKSEMLRVMLANSITLTPGTITVSMDDDVLTVHCLDKTLAEGMEDSIFVQLLEKMEEKE